MKNSFNRKNSFKTALAIWMIPALMVLPFVEEGDEVEQETVICLLEVMKCFLQVTADTKGCIEKICVESNNLVEEGTVLFLIRPE
jgi:biotin carboxyl carrier protein